MPFFVTNRTTAGLRRRIGSLATVALVLMASATAAGKHPKKPAMPESTEGAAILWREPADWATRDLYYGPGGKEHLARGPFTFVKEDLDGTNPKFVVKDQNGVKWKLKMGLEVRPETVASRLVWSAGYFANDDYLVEDCKVLDLPAHLHRGQKLVSPDGTIYMARLKREPDGEKKIGNWQWTGGELSGSRELNGLKVLMALMNNWDLKDVNNAVYRAGSERIFLVSDLGATFGSPGRTWPRDRAKDNLESYTRSKFIRRTTPDTVDFQVPARPMWVYLVNPKEYMSRVHLEKIGRNVPRADAKWLGQLLARLSPAQIRDAFRAGGYSPEEIEAFSRVLEDRIQTLTDL